MSLGEMERRLDRPCLMRSGGGDLTTLEFGERLRPGEDLRDWRYGDLLCIAIPSCVVIAAPGSRLFFRSTEPGLSPASNFCHFACRGGLSRPMSISCSRSEGRSSTQSAGLG